MALDKYQIAFWPEYGTLLGAIREGKMIDGDYDIDLATYSDFLLDEFEPVSKELYNLGYDVHITKSRFIIKESGYHVSLYLYQTNVTPGHITRHRVSKKNIMGKILVIWYRGLSTSHKDMIHKHTPKTKSIEILKQLIGLLPSKRRLCDILLLFGTKIGSLISYDVNIPQSYVKEFKEIPFYGMKINVPIESEKYLEHIYGKSWRIPDKNWHPWKSFYSLMKKYNDRLEKSKK